MSNTPKTRKLALRLLKESFEPDSALKDGHGLDEHVWPPLVDGRLLTGRSGLRPPKWIDFLEEGTGEKLNLGVRHASAVLFIPVASRWMVLTFGGGLYALKQESYEIGFGLRCVLNAIDPNSLKSLDVSTPEQTTIQRRIQASQASELGIFNITTDRDILKKIQGKAADNEFAKNMTGADALTMSTPVFAKNLEKKCEEILEIYRRENYKERFGWVDYVAHVRDKLLSEELNARLIENLRSGAESAHLAAPEIIDPEIMGDFRYRGTRSRETYPTLSLTDYLAAAEKSTLTMEQLKRHKVVLVQDDNTELTRWPIFNCLVYETDHQGGLYVLSTGCWYRVDTDFADEVNAFFQKIVSGPILPDTNVKTTEDTYIDDLKAAKPDWACLHTKNIKCDKWSSPIESCDFLTPENQFIHIKNKAESATLSHLFNQGMVSAEAFKREAEFRKELNARIRDAHLGFHSPCPDHERPIAGGDFSVVYAVMREPYKGSYDMGLPFFSKVALRNAKQRLDDLGFQTQFSWVRKKGEAA